MIFKDNENNDNNISNLNMNIIPNTEPSSLLLSIAERSLCRHLNLLPRQYMTIKEVLLMEHMRNGCIKQDFIKKFQNIEKKINPLLDFFQRCHWIVIDNNDTSTGRPKKKAIYIQQHNTNTS